MEDYAAVGRLSGEQKKQQLKSWNDALAEHVTRWRQGTSLAPNVKHPRPSNLEDAKLKCLQRHNQLRARHNAPPLQWSDDLAQIAYGACTDCMKENKSKERKVQRKATEKLVGSSQCAFFAEDGESFNDAIDRWYGEIDSYNFEWLLKVQKCLCHDHPEDADEPDWDFTGHKGPVDQFIQVISKRATHVGMAKAGECIVARYEPQDEGHADFIKVSSDEFKIVSAISQEGKAEALAEGVREKPMRVSVDQDVNRTRGNSSASSSSDRESRKSSPSRPSQSSAQTKQFHISSMQEKNIKKLFQKADRNKDGFLNSEELEDIMEKLGMVRKDVQRLLSAADGNKDGKLDVDEFLTWLFSDNKKARLSLQYATG